MLKSKGTSKLGVQRKTVLFTSFIFTLLISRSLKILDLLQKNKEGANYKLIAVELGYSDQEIF